MVSLCYNISIMKNYIVFDLEWNQSANGKERSIPHFPFEIIEIGAVKLNEAFQMVDEFHRLIRPQVYTQMHHAISEVTHMDMKELRNSGELFPDAAADFLSWCGGDAVFCTWGNMDLLELQRNMDYYHMDNPFPKPLFIMMYKSSTAFSAVRTQEFPWTLPWKSKVFWKTGRFTAPWMTLTTPESFSPCLATSPARIPSCHFCP